MYLRPSSTTLSHAELADLLGPVETQYVDRIEVAQCGGCDALNVTLVDSAITQLQITAPNCNGNITGFQLTASSNQQLGGSTQNEFIPVAQGTFNGDVWTANTQIALGFFGSVNISVDVVNGAGSTGPLCNTTVFVSAR